MKLRVGRDILADAVTWAGRTIPPRPAIPVLSGIHLSADGSGVLSISAYDPESTSCVEAAADVDEAGECLVNGKMLGEICRSLPARPVDMTLDGTRLDIECGSASFSLNTMALEEYPAMPETPTQIGTVDAADWQEAVTQVATAASKDETLPLLVSICIEIDGENISLLATDRYRLAVRDLTWQPANPQVKERILVKASRLAEIAKAYASSERVVLSVDQLSDDEGGAVRILGFEAVGRQNTSRLIDGDYPQVRSLFPQQVNGHAVVSRSELLEAIKRSKIVVERNSAVRLSFTDGNVTVEGGQGGDNAQAKEDVPARLVGEDISMSFNPLYLQDALSVTHGDYVRLSFTNDEKPVVLSAQAEEDGEDSPEFRVLLMPIRKLG
ncbi:MAG: DNA polymerase III subunit beta [Flaviflexus sp.]|nr:DNA polymerase III subunit beta [Flaviflexus sp.]